MPSVESVKKELEALGATEQEEILSYSRKVVGWKIWLDESTENAGILVCRTVLSEQRTMISQLFMLH